MQKLPQSARRQHVRRPASLRRWTQSNCQKIVSKTKKEAFRRPSTRLISAGGVPLDIYNTSDKLLNCFPLAWQAKNQRYNKITV